MFKELKIYFTLKKYIPKGGFTMKNWRTSLAGIIAALSTILPQFGVSQELAQAIQVVAMAAWAILSKDASVTGTTKM